MTITFDPAKRGWTLEQRGIDFLDAEAVFAEVSITFEDTRQDYGELRLITYGALNGRMVVVVWTPRGFDRHVFSMRKANEREQARFGQQLSKNRPV